MEEVIGDGAKRYDVPPSARAHGGDTVETVCRREKEFLATRPQAAVN